MNPKYLLFAIPLGLLSFSAISQKQKDSTAIKNAAKADVLLQKNTIYDKTEVKKSNTSATGKIKRKHKRHIGKRKVKFIRK
jgi:hypothetical protein